MPTKKNSLPAEPPAPRPLKPLKEKDDKFKAPRGALQDKLEDQDNEISAKLERVEEKIIQNHERNQRDSNPVASVFVDLAQKAIWSG